MCVWGGGGAVDLELVREGPVPEVVHQSCDLQQCGWGLGYRLRFTVDGLEDLRFAVDGFENLRFAVGGLEDVDQPRDFT